MGEVISLGVSDAARAAYLMSELVGRFRASLTDEADGRWEIRVEVQPLSATCSDSCSTGSIEQTPAPRPFAFGAASTKCATGRRRPPVDARSARSDDVRRPAAPLQLTRRRRWFDAHLAPRCLGERTRALERQAPAAATRHRTVRLETPLAELLEGFDLVAVVAGDDAATSALCERRHDLAGKAQDRRLVRRAVADHECAAAFGQAVEDAAERSAKQLRVLCDELRVGFA